jgi:hypothetical protein
MQGGEAASTMPNEKEGLGMLAMCTIIVALSVAGVVAAFVTRLVDSVDGLLLLMISLMMGGVFALMLLLTAKEEGWLPSRAKKKDSSAKAGAGK